MKIALIGAGEMGSAVGARLRERGARVVTLLRGRSAASAERVRAAGLEVVENERDLVGGAAFVLSIVPPGKALEVAQRLLATLTEAVVKPRYVECNAIAPHTAVAIGEALRPSGCDLIDAGIIGGPPAAGYDGPRIYASGAAAAALEELGAFGLSVRVLGGDVGMASALKMSYAGITKGLTGIGAGMMLDASRAGVASALRRELEESQPQVYAWLARQVPRMYPKAYRWIAEMREIASFSQDDPGTEAIYQGLARMYEDFAERYEARGDADLALAALTEFVAALR
jgi:3-hydroxyisobutyrate dehydrogenase-like beta-hydroxyacid dehydrogenase